MLKASPFDQKGVRGGFDGLEGHALQGGRVEHLGLEDMLAHFTVAAGFKKAGLPAARHEAEQRLVRRGASGSPQGLDDALAHFTMDESAAGFKKMLRPQLRGIKQSRGSTSE